MKKELDGKDHSILAILQSEGRLSAENIGKRIGIPKNTVLRRLRRLKGQGYIKAFSAVLDPYKLEKSVGVLVLVNVTMNDEPNKEEAKKEIQQRIAGEILKIPGVQSAWVVSGPYDIVIRARAETVFEVGEIVIKRLRLIEGVKSTLTCIDLLPATESLKLQIPELSGTKGSTSGKDARHDKTLVFKTDSDPEE